MKDLILLDPETGKRENYGLIVKKRSVGSVPLWLTYDASNRMWWIVWQDDRVRMEGYREPRREICWTTFHEMNETRLAAHAESA